jgi:DNA invertase Pin-like site-specific DNA recombinase
MTQTSALIAAVPMLLGLSAAIAQAARAVTRARIRREQRLSRLASVVNGLPAESSEDQFAALKTGVR